MMLIILQMMLMLGILLEGLAENSGILHASERELQTYSTQTVTSETSVS
jgi:hypothetical protein